MNSEDKEKCISCKKAKRKDEMIIVHNRKFERLYMCKNCYIKASKGWK